MSRARDRMRDYLRQEHGKNYEALQIVKALGPKPKDPKVDLPDGDWVRELEPEEEARLFKIQLRRRNMELILATIHQETNTIRRRCIKRAQRKKKGSPK